MTFTKYLSIEKIIIINPRFESADQNLVIYIIINEVHLDLFGNNNRTIYIYIVWKYIKKN